MPGIWPSPSVTGILNHPGHATIKAAGPTVKPARPVLLAGMTFSIGTGPGMSMADASLTGPAGNDGEGLFILAHDV